MRSGSCWQSWCQQSSRLCFSPGGFALPTRGRITGPTGYIPAASSSSSGSIPLLVIMFLGGVIWIGSHELDPFRPTRMTSSRPEVQVVSLDWKWLFIYPDQGIASVNELVVPAGVPVHFSLTSASVMNMFFVPAARQHDRHHERNGHAASSAGRPSRRLSTASRPNSAATASPTCISPCAPCPPDDFARWVDDGAAGRPGLGPDGLRRARQAKPERAALHLSERRARTCSKPSRRQQLPPGPGSAGRTRRPGRHPTGGA